MPKKFALNMLPGISQKFRLLCFSVFLLCLHYVPNLPIMLALCLHDTLAYYAGIFDPGRFCKLDPLILNMRVIMI